MDWIGNKECEYQFGNKEHKYQFGNIGKIILSIGTLSGRERKIWPADSTGARDLTRWPHRGDRYQSQVIDLAPSGHIQPDELQRTRRLISGPTKQYQAISGPCEFADVKVSTNAKEEITTKSGTLEDKQRGRDKRTIMSVTQTGVGHDKVPQQQNGERKYGVRKNNNDIRNAKSDGIKVLP